MRRRTFLAASAALLAACTAPPPAATTRPASDVPKRGGTVRVGLSQEPTVLNGLLGTQTVTGIISQLVLEGLSNVDPQGRYVPQLAESIPAAEGDGLTVTWKLKKGVTWSDGKPLTSRDVRFTYDVIMNPGNPIPNRTAYNEIASLATPDEHTVVVQYKRLYAPYRGMFGSILPAHVFDGNPVIDKKEFNRAPVGSGPFKFKSWASGDSVALERNPNYRDKERPYLDGVVFKIVPSREAAIQAFKVGEIDVLWNLIEANIPEFETIADATIRPTPSPRVERLILNAGAPSGTRQGHPAAPHPVLGDPRVREAIELAIDKKALVEKLLFGKTTVATSVIPLGWYAPQLAPSAFDPARAKKLLDEAGWVPGADGIRGKGGVRAQLEFGTTTGDRLREQTQQVIKEMLKDVGVELTIKNVPSPVLLGGWADNAPRAKGNFDILMWTTNADIDPQSHLANYFHGGQVPTEQIKGGRNYHRIVDPELDRALDQAAATTDEAKRTPLYKAIAERINAGRGHVVLYSRLDIDAYKKQVRGHAVNVWQNLGWDAEGWWLAT